MAVLMHITVDDRKLAKELRKLGNDASKQLEYGLKDMRRSMGTIVSRNVREHYAIKDRDINPNSKKFTGSCSMSGGMADLTLVWSGCVLTPVHFGMKATGSLSRYTIKATILKGRRVKIGHWRIPGTEGGKYRKESPYMLLPGKVPPIKRIGGGWQHKDADHKALKVISVPQMVSSERHFDGTVSQIQERYMEIVRSRLAKLGIV